MPLRALLTADIALITPVLLKEPALMAAQVVHFMLRFAAKPAPLLHLLLRILVMDIVHHPVTVIQIPAAVVPASQTGPVAKPVLPPAEERMKAVALQTITVMAAIIVH
jgi:hypothetical protein